VVTIVRVVQVQVVAKIAAAVIVPADQAEDNRINQVETDIV